MKRVLSLLIAICMIATTAVTPGFAYAKTSSGPSEKGIVLEEMTREEWLHNLAVVFDMSVEEQQYPDNYFSDLDSSSEYYYDVLLNVQFGVIQVDTDGNVEPEVPVTREYAASTLNYCLGYQMNEEDDYSFDDVDKVKHPAAAQIAVNQGWIELIEGAFLPDKPLTVEEGKRMLDETRQILADAEIDEEEEDICVFEEDVVVIPEEAQVEFVDEDTLTVVDYPGELQKGDTFGIYINGVPNVYEVVTMTIMDGVATIDYTDVEQEKAFDELEVQGTIDSSKLELIPAEGTETEVIEAFDLSTSFKARKPIRLKTFKVTNSLTLPNSNGTFSLEFVQPTLYYELSLTKTSRVYLEGDINTVYALSATLGEPIYLGTVGAPGVGGVSFYIDGALEGSAKGCQGFAMTMGIEFDPKNGTRLIKDFSCKTFSLIIDATGSLGVMAKMGLTEMPIIKGYVYGSIGARGKINRTTYMDEKAPKVCSEQSAYFYVDLGVALSADLGMWKVNESCIVEVFNERNSPIRLVGHYDDGKKVARCGRDTGTSSDSQKQKYFTSASSPHSGGDALANLGYDLYPDGTPVRLFDYILNDDGDAIITDYQGLAVYLTIPNEIDGHPVVAIGERAFDGDSFLMYIELPETLKEIKYGAFAETGVKEVIFPDGIETIEAEAFGECDNLRRVYVPASVEISGYGSYGPFHGCDNLKTIELEEGITHIAANLFNGCTGLASYDIPDTVTTIRWGAFQNCSNLYNINIPESVTTIESYAFENCTALTSINIPSKVTIIPERMCNGCTNLGEINLPETVTEIGNEAFRGTMVTSVNLPDALSHLGEFAFGECQGLTSVHIPKNLTTAHTQSWGPFYHCDNLKTVTFDQGVTKIADVLLADCSGLESVTVPETVKEIGIAAFKNCNNLTEVILPEGLTVIGHSAFMNCSALQSINIPATLTTIDPYGFYYCTALEEVILPDGFTTFTRNYNGVSRAFEGCSGLKTVVIPHGVTEIPGYAFFRCTGMEKAVIPRTVTAIGEFAFDECENLTMYGRSGSYAEAFAKEQDLAFVLDTSLMKQDPLTVNEVGKKTYGDGDFALSVKGGSGTGAVTWSVPEDNGVLEINGNTASIIGAGKVVITATKAGDHEYLAAGTAYTINIAPSKTAKLKLSKTTYVYDGKSHRPTVTVTGLNGKVLKLNEDYTVTTSPRTSVGSRKVTVSLKGNYTGEKYTYFYIVPKATSKVTANLYKEYDRVKVSWNKVTGASGYLVQYRVSGGTYQKLTATTGTYTTKAQNLKDGKKYYFRVIPYFKDSSGTLRYSTYAAKSTSVYTLKKVTQKTIRKYSSTKVTVRWYDIPGQTGYQISRSTKVSGRSVYATVKSTSAASKTIKTTKGKTYYYRVRAYKKVGDTYIYGPWSDYQKKKI